MPQSIIEASINVIVSIVLVHYMGIYGVLVGTLVALLYRTNEAIFYGNRKLLNRYPWRTYLVSLLNIIVFIVSQLLFRNIFPSIKSLWDLIWISAFAGIIALVMFVGTQTLAWKNNRALVKRHL